MKTQRTWTWSTSIVSLFTCGLVACQPPVDTRDPSTESPDEGGRAMLDASLDAREDLPDQGSDLDLTMDMRPAEDGGEMSAAQDEVDISPDLVDEVDLDGMTPWIDPGEVTIVDLDALPLVDEPPRPQACPAVLAPQTLLGDYIEHADDFTGLGSVYFNQNGDVLVPNEHHYVHYYYIGDDTPLTDNHIIVGSEYFSPFFVMPRQDDTLIYWTSSTQRAEQPIRNFDGHNLPARRLTPTSLIFAVDDDDDIHYAVNWPFREAPNMARCSRSKDACDPALSLPETPVMLGLHTYVLQGEVFWVGEEHIWRTNPETGQHVMVVRDARALAWVMRGDVLVWINRSGDLFMTHPGAETIWRLSRDVDADVLPTRVLDLGFFALTMNDTSIFWRQGAEVRAFDYRRRVPHKTSLKGYDPRWMIAFPCHVAVYERDHKLWRVER